MFADEYHAVSETESINETKFKNCLFVSQKLTNNQSNLPFQEPDQPNLTFEFEEMREQPLFSKQIKKNFTSLSGNPPV